MPISSKVGKVLNFRLLSPYPSLALGTESSDLLNFLSYKFDLYQSNYLEVGIEHGRTLEAVKNDVRFGVDPNPKFINLFRKNKIRVFPISSSDFFSELDPALRFGMVFLDGLHTAEQTFQDLTNVSKHLLKNSIVVLDDSVPIDRWSAIPHQETALKLRKEYSASDRGSWQGDVYRVVMTLDTLKIDGLRFITIMDISNPKTVIWAEMDRAWLELSKMGNVEINPSVDFDLLVSEVIPNQFNPTAFSKFTQDFDKLFCNR